jgi:anti-sigma factor RsiW
MSWTCLNTEERLMEYLEGELPATERVLVEAHLAECAACRALAAQVRWVETRLPRLEPEVEPVWLVRRILATTAGAERGKRESRWKTILAGLTSPRFAVGLGTVAATFFFLFHALGINPKKITAQDLNPVNVYRAADRQAHLSYARGVRFVNDLRVVYEIRSRLEEASATPTPPVQREAPKSAPSPQSERQLKNDLLRKGPSMGAAVAGMGGVL